MVFKSNIGNRKKNRKDSTNFRHWKMTLKFRILRSLIRLFIMLISLKMSLLGEQILFPIDTLVVWCPTWSKNLGRSLACSGKMLRLFSSKSYVRNYREFGWQGFDPVFFFHFRTFTKSCEIVTQEAGNLALFQVFFLPLRSWHDK